MVLLHRIQRLEGKQVKLKLQLTRVQVCLRVKHSEKCRKRAGRVDGTRYMGVRWM